MIISDTIYVRRLFLFNRVTRLSKAEQNTLSKNLRKESCRAWSHPAEFKIRVELKYPLKFSFSTFVNVTETLPDVDSGMWVAKRMLDGAVDAGVILDDTPEYISRVIINAPVFTDAIHPSKQGSYIATLVSDRGE